MNTQMTHEPWIVGLDDPAAAEAEKAGGKALGLHALIRAGLPVPPGVCVTTSAFRWAIAGDPTIAAALVELDACPVDAPERLRELAAALRLRVAASPLPAGLEEALVAAVAGIGEATAFAVRSSATAEDLADASFAGLQDSFLHVPAAAIADRVRACWASLFSDRAVLYRRHRGIAAGEAAMAVVVQAMIDADAAGVIFTADPTTGHRGVAVIEAVWGLGELLVSGRAAADITRVRRGDGAILEQQIADKREAAVRAGAAGVRIEDVPEDRRKAAVLDPAAARRLCELALRAEASRGSPQDVEWAIAGGRIWLLQSRAITTLFPRPAVDDGRRHVFVSLGHIQVNTAPLTPFGISVLRRLIPFAREDGRSRLLQEAGGRAYVDVTPALERAPLRWIVPAMLSIMHAPTAARIRVLRRRPEVIAAARATRPKVVAMLRFIAPIFVRALGRALRDPMRMSAEMIAFYDAQVAGQRGRAAAAADTGARLRVLQADLAGEFDAVLRRGVGPLLPLIVAGDRLLRRLVRRHCPDAAADALLRGLSGNATTEMDLALGDLADRCRDLPQVVAAIRSDDPAAALAAVRGRLEAAGFFAAWDAFLARYGVRCAGEIDVGVPRWRDRPDALLRAIVGLLDRPAGAHRAQHEAARIEAERVAAAVEAGARRGLFGWLKGPLVRAVVARARAAHALREHHKLALIEFLDLLHAAALDLGASLVRTGALERADQVFSLTLEEAIVAADAHARGATLPGLADTISARAQAHARHAAMTPPPVMTDEGEVPTLPIDVDAPPGTLCGVAVSSGVIEGRARVILDPSRETLAAGEILVAPFTDPGWTALFMHASALVMEIGGLMTHGSVIAREIGIPAVVAVDGATRTIRSGQRIRVDGDRGWVTVLDDDAGSEGAS